MFNDAVKPCFADLRVNSLSKKGSVINGAWAKSNLVNQWSPPAKKMGHIFRLPGTHEPVLELDCHCPLKRTDLPREAEAQPVVDAESLKLPFNSQSGNSAHKNLQGFANDGFRPRVTTETAPPWEHLHTH